MGRSFHSQWGAAVLTLKVHRNFSGYESRSVSSSIVSSDQPDPNINNNTTATTSNPGYNAHDLRLSKSLNNTAPNVGETVTFTITLSKVSGGNTVSLQVIDKLPPGFTYVSSNTNGTGTYDPSTGIWDLGSPDTYSNFSRSLTITATVNTPTGVPDEYRSVAALTHVGLDPDVSNNIAIATAVVDTGDPTDLGQTFVLENIHYDFDQHHIRADAAVILDELVKTLQEHPTLKIELSSHTDSRGNDAYNLALSQRRAQAAVDYLVSRGIARERMVAKGYGEERLVNRCTNGTACSEAEHQANRRTEITVLAY
ncbi:conserved repeat domain-containing protein [Parapedobacter composti]|uniref:Conserved repeat domain-containing protein n=1 Tax=Parapedobacter composti TaxID=623281 RepID=A0A1I1F6S5_9SPHI|nr:OmpA family protein [Parapedobacter composti]SFB93418.1 conserved repeat domain-containing protein [Parapedobacter composti]